MKGIIIYKREDYKKNISYINWLKDIGKTLDLEFDIFFEDNFYSCEFSKYNFAINRSRNINLTYKLELNNIRVFNKSEITFIGNNKLAGYKYALDKGFDFSDIILENNCKDFIEKPIYGHGGEGIFKTSEFRNMDVFYQKFILNIIGDVRFYIINNQIIHSIIRSNPNSITSNYTKGGVVELYKYSKFEEKQVYKFISGLEIDYCGIDFLVTKDGRFLFNEVEDVVGSRALSYLGINNTSELFISHIKKQLINNI